MDTEVIVGQTVTLSSFNGPIVRLVLEVVSDVVVVCRSEELKRARREHRPPLTVGFRMRDVLKVGS